MKMFLYINEIKVYGYNSMFFFFLFIFFFFFAISNEKQLYNFHCFNGQHGLLKQGLLSKINNCS